MSGPGCNVVTAASGQQALSRILKTDFALILMDVRMPDMDGFETATLVRKVQRSRHTPIIFLTAAGENEEWLLRGYEVGAVDYIVKPVDAEVLKSKVAVFVELNSQITGLALQTDLTGEQREYLGLLKASGEALRAIVNGILDFSKIEAGRLDIEI